MQGSHSQLPAVPWEAGAEQGREASGEATIAGKVVNNVKVTLMTKALLSNKQKTVLRIESCLPQIHMLMS